MQIPFALRTQSEAPLYRMEIVKIDYYYVKLRLFLLAGSPNIIVNRARGFRAMVGHPNALSSG